MSRCVFGIRFWVGLALIFLLFHPMCAEPAVGGTAASAPATQAALSGQAAIAKLRAEGIESALAGRFGEGLDKLHAVVSASPDDKLASAATGLVRQYMVRRKHSESERADEYEQAVARIGRCFLAQDHLSGLAESKAGKLRQQVRDIVADCAEAANSESLEKADDENAAKLKKQALKALAKAAKRLKQVEKRLVKDKSQYAETFRQVAKSLSSCLANCRAGWTAARTTSPEDRLAASQRLKVLENALAEALADVEAMVAKKPWRGALMYGLGAKMLLGGEGQLADQQWYRKLVAEVEAQAKQAMADTRWYDALAAYSGLEELDPDSQTYHDLAKTARKHVRILSLYGKSAKGASALGGQTPATRPGSVPAEQDMDWRTLVANVDVEMIREAISQLDLYYVKVVDYRKLARGALVGIKVLAETPQAAETFGGLKDKTKRAEFLKAVEKLLGDIDKRDNVDHMDVKLVLNSVLGASIGISTVRSEAPRTLL
ncbi:MAG: hypothetical protein SVT52_00260, partial [Planctomycetota bacterium]|nr:hypothetical protein [Planctomycetota bacterium]